MGTRRLQHLLARLRTVSPEEARFAAAAWLLAPWALAALRQHGLEAALLRVEEVPAWLGRLAGSAAPAPATRAVGWAFRAHPWLPSACLGRSLVQHALHRAAGVESRFVIGVRGGLDDFGAHAWVDAGEGATEGEGFAEIFARGTPPLRTDRS